MACDRGWELQRDCLYAVVERIAAEETLGEMIDGDFEERKKRLEAAEVRRSAAWGARTHHIAECAVCFSDPPS